MSHWEHLGRVGAGVKPVASRRFRGSRFRVSRFRSISNSVRVRGREGWGSSFTLTRSSAPLLPRFHVSVLLNHALALPHVHASASPAPAFPRFRAESVLRIQHLHVFMFWHNPASTFPRFRAESVLRLLHFHAFTYQRPHC